MAIGRKSSVGLLLGFAVGGGLFLSEGREPTLPVGSRTADVVTPTSEGSLSSAAADSPSFIGVILPAEAVDVTARADGRILEVRAGPGQRVERGTVLAVLDTEALALADLEIAEVELAAAKADVTRLQIEVEHAAARRSRVEALAARQLVSAQAVEEAVYEQKVAEARLFAAESLVPQKRAVLHQRQMLRDNARITAPVSGTVSVHYVDRAATVSRGTPIFRIVAAGSLRLRFAVPSEEAMRLRAGVKLAVDIPEIDAHLTARVDATASEIDSASRMLLAYATINDDQSPGHALGTIAGRAVRVRIVPASQ